MDGWVRLSVAVVGTLVCVACGASSPPASSATGPAPSGSAASSAADTPPPPTSAQVGPEPAGGGEKYTLNLSRDSVQGRVIDYSATTYIKNMERRVQGGRVIKNSRSLSKMHFEAEAHVIKAEGGNALQREYRVKLLELETPAGPKQLLGPGDVVVVHRKMNTPGRIELKGKKLPDDIRRVLTYVTQPRLTKGTSADLYGPSEPKAVGDIWPIQGERASAFYRSMDIHIDPKQFEGSARLMELTETNGIQTLHVVAGMTARMVKLDAVGPNARVIRGDLAVKEARFVPLDPQVPVTRGDIEVVLDYQAELPDPGGPIQLEMAIARTARLNIIVKK